MKYSVAAVVPLLAAVSSARKCQNLTIPITASGRNGVFDYSIPTTEIEITDFALNLARQGTNYTAKLLTGYKTVSGNYHISATYCQPDSGASSALQILTHGIGFDKTYWDLPFHDYNYSYVNEAVDTYGYDTFAWDRLGISASSHGNPLSEIQSFLEVGALKALTTKLKNGEIPGLPSSYNKVMHVGHSFGSEHTYLLTAMYPDITDCIGLTGFSQNASFFAQFLLGSNLIQANTIPALSEYPDGYLANGDIQSLQVDFFSPGDFDPAMLKYAYSIGQPATVGEILTITGEVFTINTFPGPVHIITGERDIPYCGGNCNAAPTGYANIPSKSKTYFPDASVFDVTIIPGAGHGLNFEYTHPRTYASVNNFFLHNGCAPLGKGNSSHPHWPPGDLTS